MQVTSSRNPTQVSNFTSKLLKAIVYDFLNFDWKLNKISFLKKCNGANDECKENWIMFYFKEYLYFQFNDLLFYASFFFNFQWRKEGKNALLHSILIRYLHNWRNNVEKLFDKFLFQCKSHQIVTVERSINNSTIKEFESKTST